MGEKSYCYKLKPQELNDLNRNRVNSVSKSELQKTRRKQWNLLGESLHIVDKKKLYQCFSNLVFFKYDLFLPQCKQAGGIDCNPSDWRLFIHGLSRNLKAMLLHNGNKHTSLPLIQSVNLKDEQSCFKILLDAFSTVGRSQEISKLWPS